MGFRRLDDALETLPGHRVGTDLGRNTLPREYTPPVDMKVPDDWRREEPLSSTLEMSQQHWPVFLEWCRSRGRRPLPAAPAVLLAFLLDPPIRGPELYEAWCAIWNRHEAYFWHTDGNCAQLLFLGGVRVSEEGEVSVPEKVRVGLSSNVDYP